MRKGVVRQVRWKMGESVGLSRWCKEEKFSRATFFLTGLAT